MDSNRHLCSFVNGERVKLILTDENWLIKFDSFLVVSRNHN